MPDDIDTKWNHTDKLTGVEPIDVTSEDEVDDTLIIKHNGEDHTDSDRVGDIW